MGVCVPYFRDRSVYYVRRGSMPLFIFIGVYAYSAVTVAHRPGPYKKLTGRPPLLANVARFIRSKTFKQERLPFPGRGP